MIPLVDRESKLTPEQAQDPLLVLAEDIGMLHDEVEAVNQAAGLPVHPAGLIKDLREHLVYVMGMLTAFELSLKQISKGETPSND